MSSPEILATQLTELLVTKQTADIFINSLQSLYDLTYTTHTDFLKVVHESFPQIVATIFEEILMQQNTSLGRNEIQQLILSIKAVLSSIPVITITFPQKPSQLLLQDVLVKIKTYTKTPLLIDVSSDEKIIGGIQIHFKGVYKDYSLLSQIKAKQLIHE